VERASSFGAVAEEYDRLRPTPVAKAIDWLLPFGTRTVVDIGAGTGLATRALVADGRHVVAVEPDSRMRLVLRTRTPGASVVGGRGEALPLRTGSADAVVAASSWHWMDPGRARAEVVRVLRPGGRLGLVWTSWDRDVPWIKDLDDALAGASGGQAPRQQSMADQFAETGRVLPSGRGLSPEETATFRAVRELPLDDAVALMGTYSGVITASARVREAAQEAARRTLTERSSSGVVALPVASWCFRADREDEGGRDAAEAPDLVSPAP
jgi:SAM-dependent methyltransferase